MEKTFCVVAIAAFMLASFTSLNDSAKKSAEIKAERERRMAEPTFPKNPEISQATIDKVMAGVSK